MITPLTQSMCEQAAGCFFFSFIFPSLLSLPLSLLHIFCRDEQTASPGQPYPGNRQPSSGPHADPDSCTTHRLCLQRKTCSVFIFHGIYIPWASTSRTRSRWLGVVFAVTSSGPEDADLLFIYSRLSVRLSWSRWSDRMHFMRRVPQRLRMKLCCLYALYFQDRAENTP